MTSRPVGQEGHCYLVVYYLSETSASKCDHSKSNFNSSDGRVVRASASGAEDLGLIPSRIKAMN